MEEKLVAKVSHLFATYDAIQAGQINGVSLPRKLISVARLTVGVFQTLALIQRYRPTALLITGGFVTFPVAVACWLRRVPIAIYLPDIEPGQAIKATARLAQVVYTTTSDSSAYFRPGLTQETGYPVRKELLSATREAGLPHFELDPALQTLLVFGGSRGSRSINQAVINALPDLIKEKIQLLHISGELDRAAVETAHAALPIEQRSRYKIFSYLHATEMGLALASADLVVSRAGASALGEFPLFGLPAILVPYPYAWRYQKVNADSLAGRGAAIRLNDESLSTDLLPLLQRLLNDSTELERMKSASLALARRDGAVRIAQALLRLSNI
jgi:UDP-N-acetylglucosamine--N-acetylmuramyl-(pentapeptide) pyrophosphoryl-undecaprenol N-acetylglucosamine transferase